MKHTCPGCQTEGEGKDGSVADNNPPGWACAVSHGGGVVHVCGVCAKEAGDCARRIQELVKDKHAYFPSLLKWGLAPVKEY